MSNFLSKSILVCLYFSNQKKEEVELWVSFTRVVSNVEILFLISSWQPKRLETSLIHGIKQTMNLTCNLLLVIRSSTITSYSICNLINQTGNKCIDIISTIAHLNPKLMFMCQLQQGTFDLSQFIHQVGSHFKTRGNVRIIITDTETPKEEQTLPSKHPKYVKDDNLNLFSKNKKRSKMTFS